LSRVDVLVAVNAGPVWTPLFPILAGVVLDEGAPFRHPATTAREYGVPAVLQTRRATTIKDGDWVIVDRSSGAVELESTRPVHPSRAARVGLRSAPVG
jgi:pyruvate,water dikinase